MLQDQKLTLANLSKYRSQGGVLRSIRLVLILVSFCILAGCSLPTRAFREAEDRIFAVMLQPSDLPQGWQADFGSIRDEEDVIARSRGFYDPGLERYSVLVSHQVSVYTSEQAARDAYPRLESRWFPTVNWVEPSDLSYQSATADQFSLRCIAVTITGVPAHSCRAVEQYGDMSSVLLANVFEDRWFTRDDLEHLLQVIDQRLAAQTQ